MTTWFHIGYPKAGSSLLQKAFFSMHSEINFLGRIPVKNTGLGTEIGEHPYLSNKNLQELHDRIISPSCPDEELKKFKNLIRNSGSSQKINLLSSEFITSVFFSFPDIREKLKRVQQIGVDGVLIVLRNQVALIKSIYREHPFHPSDLVHGAPISIDDWIKASDLLEYSYLESLKFYDIIEFSNEIFGSSKVHILLFEELISNPVETAKKLNRYFGLDQNESKALIENARVENRGVSARYNFIRNLKKRIIGEVPIADYLPEKLTEATKLFLKKGGKADYVLQPDTVSFLNDYYAKSNQNLVELNLKSFNYPPHYSI